MRIIGIDPGSIVTGYGVVEYHLRQIKLVTCGAINTPSKKNFPERLKMIYEGICQILKDFHPQFVSIEDVFYAKNIQAVLKLGQTRGVVMLAAANFEIPIVEYSPRKVKQAVTGNGAASKEQVSRAVGQILELSSTPTPHDVTDALAAAICHCHRIDA
jgi:crossover junction endodeoxyribonuclease RuvC